MYTHYLYWHYVRAPIWLAHFEWNLERALLRYFSVGVMVKTLVAHWHQDKVSYNQGTITGIAVAFGFNLISRGIGFVVRSSVLLVWLLAQTVYAALAVLFFVFFLAWPVLTVFTFVSALAWLAA